MKMPGPKFLSKSLGKEEGGDEPSDGMVCGSRLVSMYEMWKRKQIHENARQM